MECTEDELKAMRRSDLQKLCKKIGIKANMKTEMLLEAVMNYYDEEVKNGNQGPSVAVQQQGEVDIGIKEAQGTVEETSGAVDNHTETPANGTKVLPKRNSREKAKRALKGVGKVKQSKIPKLDRNIGKIAKTAETKTESSTKMSKSKRQRTPKDWAKIHQKQFEKMDSVDVYLSKKKQRANKLVHFGKNPNVTPKFNVATPMGKTGMSKKKGVVSFNFASLAKENAMKSPSVGKQYRTPNNASEKPVTPFRLSTNMMPFGSPTPRKKFDLTASLAKPLNYKPYKGKLPTPPYAKKTQSNRSVRTSTTKPAVHQQDVKAVKITSRRDRRERQQRNQSQARQSAIGRRRGLVN